MDLCRYCGHDHFGGRCTQEYDMDGEIRTLRRIGGYETKMPCGHWTDEHAPGRCPDVT